MKLRCQMVFTLLVSLSYIIGNVSSFTRLRCLRWKNLVSCRWRATRLFPQICLPLISFVTRNRIHRSLELRGSWLIIWRFSLFDGESIRFLRRLWKRLSVVGAENDAVSVYAISGSERHGQLVVTYDQNSQKEGNPTSIGILDIASGKIRANWCGRLQWMCCRMVIGRILCAHSEGWKRISFNVGERLRMYEVQFSSAQRKGAVPPWFFNLGKTAPMK